MVVKGSFSSEEFHWSVGIEDTFVPQVYKKGERSLDEYELTQHYRFWQGDLDLAKELGVQMIRYGVPWYKANPSRGKYDWKWTDQVLDYLVVKNEIDPIIDLVHFGTPLWLHGEFSDISYPKYLCDYVGEFVRRYKHLVRYYTPVNEPMITAMLCGTGGVDLPYHWPPYLRGPEGFVALLKNLCKGAILTIRTIREIDPQAVIVYVEATMLYETKADYLREEAKLRQDRTYLSWDLVTGRVNEAHPFYSRLLAHGLTEEEISWFQENRVDFDVAGLNYYPHWGGRELYQEEDVVKERLLNGGVVALASLIRTRYERYSKPIFITETGVPGSDAQKVRWLEESLAEIRRLRESGIIVIGYTWWPLFDAISWEYRTSGRPLEECITHVGLWRLDPQRDKTLKRVRTRAVDHFKSLLPLGSA